jgi:hypothetical protein
MNQDRRCHARLSAWVFVVVLLASPAATVNAQEPLVAVLDLGSAPTAHKAAETLRRGFRSSGELRGADTDLSRAAAKGSGYAGSLNLTVTEARDLGAALATQFSARTGTGVPRSPIGAANRIV